MTSLPDPQVAAVGLLNTVWADLTGSAHSIPVDPAQIALRLGIDVFEDTLPADVSGVIVKDRGRDPTIVLNRLDHPNRQRFTCAHELGHYVANADSPDEFEYVDRRDDRSSTGRDPDEVFSNQFAAELLMPAEVVKRLSRQGLSPVEMAYEFRVSQDAMQFRLQKLGMAA